MTTNRKKKLKNQIPPPPPPGATHGTINETAGYLRVKRGGLNRLRACEPTFPQPVLIGGGSPRFVLAEIDGWLASRPRGWATTGGSRPSNFGRGPANITTPDTIQEGR